VITLLDYGMGNLRSVEKALVHVGAEVRVTSRPAEVEGAERLVVPGVGAFGQAMDHLRASGLDRAILAAVARGAGYFGICLGMQLLFETSEEHGSHRGLGLLPGRVLRLPERVKVPEVGWNQVTPVRPDPLFEGIPESQFFYFDQSFYCEPSEPSDLLAETEYGLRYASAVRRGRLSAVQFHPEKSQKHGLRMLRNFAGAA
jgi:imidazole glycerol-phosphate synthase subunit HisH